MVKKESREKKKTNNRKKRIAQEFDYVFKQQRRLFQSWLQHDDKASSERATRVSFHFDSLLCVYVYATATKLNSVNILESSLTSSFTSTSNDDYCLYKQSNSKYFQDENLLYSTEDSMMICFAIPNIFARKKSQNLVPFLSWLARCSRRHHSDGNKDVVGRERNEAKKKGPSRVHNIQFHLSSILLPSTPLSLSDNQQEILIHFCHSSQ